MAPNAIAACNGPTCAEFLEDPSSHDAIVEETDDGVDSKRVLVDFPGVWTEMEGGYQTWGGSPDRPTAYFWGRGADDARARRWRGSREGARTPIMYMYAGGNNFGRTAGDAITTAYATDVNVCPDGLPNEPKFTHLGNAHAALASAAKILLEDDPRANAAVPLAHAPVLVGDEDGDGTWDGPRERDEDDASIGKKKTETKTRTDSGRRARSFVDGRREATRPASSPRFGRARARARPWAATTGLSLPRRRARVPLVRRVRVCGVFGE